MSRTCGLITPKDNTPGWVDEYDVSTRGCEGGQDGPRAGGWSRITAHGRHRQAHFTVILDMLLHIRVVIHLRRPTRPHFLAHSLCLDLNSTWTRHCCRGLLV